MIYWVLFYAQYNRIQSFLKASLTSALKLNSNRINVFYITALRKSAEMNFIFHAQLKLLKLQLSWSWQSVPAQFAAIPSKHEMDWSFKEDDKIQGCLIGRSSSWSAGNLERMSHLRRRNVLSSFWQHYADKYLNFRFAEVHGWFPYLFYLSTTS